ncbi:AcrR family transcriptional regulator [Rhodococcus sp. 27YEA15]|uniref:TetR/AcrR family transcriptional regulator n=1 Tax=Rhodococcus sp. 27YEA15 TaxID=3156259 RepID=UPI003C7A7AEC
MADRSTTMRADAKQNRDAILVTATAILTGSEDVDVSMNAIAKLAGVGNATLHRNFPTRESLILAVYEHEVDRVVASAHELLEDNAAPDALRLWVARLAQYAMTKRGLAGALQTASYSEDAHFADIYDAISGALALLLSAAEVEGAITPGVDPHDVLLALAGLWQLSPEGDWKAQAERLFGIVYRGIGVDDSRR